MSSRRNIWRANGRVHVHCPYCGNHLYEREEGQLDEVACHIALGLHVKSCKQSPDYVQSDMDRLLEDIFGKKDSDSN